ncbi:carboxylesterase/lipase family protein [Xanthomonas vesicatoria]|uniref:Carboxylic ester hydrolase n=2 Tax=Xanthomonas vesicatoria TaxID=56460 RepID=A0ABS8L6I3_9XANT|nr:carboxylesterase/lipase family protein [Xanthomonas vesicatoria]APO96866.1 carboxylesterase [Xanthomonas vesicatoria]APP77021.1 carboxylesterase [Xanthomonas vesicatoria ATCC 35937]EGD08486.1 carboxylesterase type B [Xanthomonas vesicatoria ATCC 35937]MCC8595662.1 carboxylesterase family protein [Xanthomonas vesicatoria]MCC8605319.1 carboxylesterase family protein [Xanthomonas vesicatoria]
MLALKHLGTLVLSASLLIGCTPRRPGEVPALVHAPDARAEVVRTDSGAVRGVASAHGKAFLGVPFAAPPVGALRFHAPQPAAAWKDVRDATQAGPACLTRYGFGQKNVSEDCLTLNIYAPPGPAPAHPRAVMVWIYGGALELGSNADYDLSALAARQNVIVVAPNYRLGAFGFLAHPSLRGEGEGAYALLDQQAALRWVQRNIAAFGGDAHNVTVFGESAGAWSICYQLVSPGARGLFQRAILQSGSCLTADSSVPRHDAERGGTRMAHTLGCVQDADAAACLRALPADAVAHATPQRRGLTGSDAWAPMTGGDVLPATPAEAIANAQHMQVPVLIGNNRDEGRLFAQLLSYIGKLTLRSGYEARIQRMYAAPAPIMAHYADVAAQSRWEAFADIVTDGGLACPTRRLGQALRVHAAVYAYEFDDPQAPYGLWRLPFSRPLGAFHASELVYLFQRPWVLSGDPQFGAAQQAFSNTMQDYWGAFARTGDPNGGRRPPWPRFDGDTPLTLSPRRIGATPDFVQRHRCAFWDADAQVAVLPLRAPSQQHQSDLTRDDQR